MLNNSPRAGAPDLGNEGPGGSAPRAGGVPPDELARAYARLRATLEATTDAILVTDWEWRITDYNTRYLGLWRLTDTDVAARDYRKVVQLCAAQVVDPSAFLDRIQHIYASSPPETFDVLHCSDGRVIQRFSRIQYVDNVNVGRVWSFHDITAARRTEESLRQSYDQFSIILDHSPVGVIVVNERLQIQHVNARAMPTFAHVPELLGRSLGDVLFRFWGAPMVNEILDHFYHTLATGEPRHRQNFAGIRTDLGVEEFYDWEIHRILLPSKEHGIVCYFVNVTEHVLAQRRIEESEERLRGMFNQAAVGIAVAGFDSRFQQANRRFCDILGYTPEELYQLTFNQITHPDDRAGTADQVRKLLAGEHTEYTVEKRYVRKEGTPVWSRTTVTLLRDHLGQPNRFMGVIEDITQRKHAESALRVRERELSLIFENVSDILFYLGVENGTDFRFLAVNQAFLAATGLTQQEVVGRTVQEVIPEPSLGMVVQKYRDAIASRKTVQWEETTRDGASAKIGVVSVTPVFDAHGLCINIIGTVHDISERVNAERKLRESEARLRHALAERREELERLVTERTASLREAIAQMEEFSYSVSHDLRAPLRSIQGYAQVIFDDYRHQMDREGQDLLERIAAAARRMDQLTRDVLTYSRVGRSTIQLEPISLSALVPETLQQYLPASTRDVVTVQQPLLAVRGSEPLLAQVIANLVGNALKFVHKDRPPRIHLRTESRGAHVRFWVEDNGIGIAPEQQARIWGLFERIWPAGSYEGTGIGLSIVRRAVERMGGSVGVVSDGENGSRFWVELPAAH